MRDHPERRFYLVDHDRRVRLPIYSHDRDRLDALRRNLDDADRWTVVTADRPRSAYRQTGEHR